MNENAKTMKKLFTWVGRILVILSLFFVLRSLYQLDFKWDFSEKPYVIVLRLLGLSSFVVLYNSMNAYIWKIYLDLLTGDKLPAGEIIFVYLKSNIAKYLPGNVIQYVSRNLLGDKLNIGHKNILMATVMELVSLLFGTVIFAAMISLENTCNVFEKLWTDYGLHRYTMAVIVFMFAGCIAAAYLIKIKFGKKLKKYMSIRSITIIIKAIVLYGVIFFVSAFILFIIFNVLLGVGLPYSDVASANALSWLAGYLVPGAPGGIGIREVVLVWLLEQKCQKEKIILAAVLLRLCVVAGDFLSFLAGYLIKYIGRKKGD